MNNPGEKRLLVARPHGFCAGVRRALEIVESLEQRRGEALYCLHELVHNRQVVADLQRRGIRFVGRIAEVPRGAWLIFSAHGVTPALRREAVERGLRVVDATCPFVARIHAGVRRYAGAGMTVLLIGNRDHDEVIGIAGEAPEAVRVVSSPDDACVVSVADADKVAVVTQTTLSPEVVGAVMEVLTERFPRLRHPASGDICYATANRQAAARQVARVSDRVVVLGSANSANSNRLVDVARAEGAQASLVETPDELRRMSWREVLTAGLTAGASTPAAVIAEGIETMQSLGFTRVETLSVVEETQVFARPPLD